MSMGVKRDRDSAEMSNNTETISEDEAALYDRQIRLWGMDCQKRLRDACVLVIGLDGLGIEIVKNLTLCGVKSITLMDETLVSEGDCSAQFFAVGQLGQGRASASLPSIRELNPRVQVELDPTPPSSLDSLSRFAAVVCCGQTTQTAVKVAGLCRESGVHFYCGGTFGLYGWGFLDLLKHKFSKLSPKDAQGKQTTSFETFDYCSLESALTAKIGAGVSKRVSKVYPLLHILSAFHEKNGRFPSPSQRTNDIESLKETSAVVLEKLGMAKDKVEEETLSCVFGELSPVCAAVGGIMADQIIKGISCQGVPIHNFLLFDGDTCVGATEKIIVK